MDEVKKWVIEGPAEQGLDRANWTHEELADHLLKTKGIRTSRSAVQRFCAKIDIPTLPAANGRGVVDMTTLQVDGADIVEPNPRMRQVVRPEMGGRRTVFRPGRKRMNNTKSDAISCNCPALMMGCAGKPGNPKAADPVEQQLSKAGAVACFFPPTDFPALEGSAPRTSRRRSTSANWIPRVASSCPSRPSDGSRSGVTCHR